MGCIIRDHDRGVVLAASKRIVCYARPLVEEALAIRWGIQLALDLNLGRIEVHSDALLVVDCINEIKVIVEVEPIAMDYAMLLKKFKDASAIFVGRNSVMKTHHFVGVGNVINSRTWSGFIPSSEYVFNLVSSSGVY